MPSQAWSTTTPTASSSFRQGITTEISGAIAGSLGSVSEAWPEGLDRAPSSSPLKSARRLLRSGHVAIVTRGGACLRLTVVRMAMSGGPSTRRHFMSSLLRRLTTTAGVCVLLAGVHASSVCLRRGRGQVPSTLVSAALQNRVQEEGTARVLVELRLGRGAFVSEGRLDRATATSQRRDIKDKETRVLERLSSKQHRVTRRFSSVPLVALEVGTTPCASWRMRAAWSIESSRTTSSTPPSGPACRSSRAIDSGLRASTGRERWSPCSIRASLHPTRSFSGRSSRRRATRATSAHRARRSARTARRNR